MGFLVAIAVIGVFTPPTLRLSAWLAILALMTVFVVKAGRGIPRLRRGFLIDPSYKLSLSRLQLLPDVGVGSSEA